MSRAARQVRGAIRFLAVLITALAILSTAGTSAQAQTCTSTSTAVTAVSPGDATALAADCAALLGMVDTLRGTAAASTFNWANSLSMASWWGITLTSDKSRVARLEYQVAGLKGTIPDLSALTSLTHLSFVKNQLTGSIPNLSALTSLQELKLNENKLTGSIPDLSALTSLKKIHLGGSTSTNQFTGSIPDLSALTSLQELLISGNKLTGSIPDLSAQTSLKRLQLNSNDLTGSIVAAHLPSSLTELYLGFNDLTGSIPDLSALTSLTLLSIQGTDVTGSIPGLSALTSLERLRLAFNDLTGSIPDLSALASLKELRLQGNRLTGNLPDLSALTSLSSARFDDNELSGSITAAHFPTSLTFLWLADNELTGSIPDLSALTSLSNLDLGGNGLTGSITAAHFPSGLWHLLLDRNELTGNIPDLSALSNLWTLRLRANGLTGSIPTTLGSLSNIRDLHLAGNPQLTGGIPSQLGNLTNLADLSLCGTGLNASATLPAALETRRSGNSLTVWSCLSIADAAASDGTTLSFDLTHSTWPVRGGDSLTVDYRVGDATSASGSVTVPAISATETEATAKIEVAVTAGLVGPDGRVKVTLSVPPDSKVLKVRDTAQGTAPPLPPEPPPPDPEPDPEPPPRADEPTGGTVSGARVTLVFGQDLDRRSRKPDAGDFTVTSTSRSAASASSSADGPVAVAAAQTVNHTVTAVWVRRTSVRLTVSPPFPARASVTVTYTKGANPLRTEAGAEVGDFSHTVPGSRPAPGACASHVTPYWHGTGGFAVRPTDGRAAIVRLECAGKRFTTVEHAAEDGLIVRAVTQPMCTADDGRRIWGEITFDGIDGDGWYWVNGDRNVAVAPLVCDAQLSRQVRPPVPGGVTRLPSGDRLFFLSISDRWHGTLMVHDTSGFMGIVPHLKDMEGAGEHVAPYWKGGGGIVGRPLDGESATVRLACREDDAETRVLKPGKDGLVVELVPGCFDENGDPVRGELQADGFEDGAWYWLKVNQVAAVAPLIRRGADVDLTVPVIPGGVDVDEGPLGTLFSRGPKVAIVPRLERVEN